MDRLAMESTLAAEWSRSMEECSRGEFRMDVRRLCDGEEEGREEGRPDEGRRDEGCPDEGRRDEGCPDEGCPDEGLPDEGCRDEGCEGVWLPEVAPRAL
jgi:hypothetical protein